MVNYLSLIHISTVILGDVPIKSPSISFISTASSVTSLCPLFISSSAAVSYTHLLEKNKSFTCIDEICEPFSKLVGIVLKEYPFKLKDDSNELRETLYQLGYSLSLIHISLAIATLCF